MALRKENVTAYLNYSKGALSIEVPNNSRTVVGLKSMLSSPKFINSKASSLTFALGKNVEGEVGAVLDEGTITLTIGDSLLFAPGSEELSPEADEQLKTVLDVIESNREMTVNIKGYTDDSAIPEGARFKNNWELSALRAVNVLRWLVEHGIDPLRVTATGMGDLNPRFPNDSPENRAKNRRVEFCLERQVLK